MQQKKKLNDSDGLIFIKAQQALDELQDLGHEFTEVEALKWLGKYNEFWTDMHFLLGSHVLESFDTSESCLEKFYDTYEGMSLSVQLQSNDPENGYIIKWTLTKPSINI